MTAHQNQRKTDNLSAQTVILQASYRTAANHVAKTTVVAGVQLYEGFLYKGEPRLKAVTLQDRKSRELNITDIKGTARH